jgi:hypothetical protein
VQLAQIFGGPQLSKRGFARAKTPRTPSYCKLSSRANARDLRKISPFGRNDKVRFFAIWRPFGFAQDMLGAKNFLDLVLFNIRKVEI